MGYICSICGKSFKKKQGESTHFGRGHSEEEKREALIEELQSVAEKLGDSPSKPTFTEESEWNTGRYISMFGSWNKSLRVAGLEVNQETDITESDLLSEIRRLNREKDGKITSTKMEEKGKYGTSVYLKRFDGWINAVEKAGLEPPQKRLGKLGSSRLYGVRWIEQREKIKERDGSKCRVCSSESCIIDVSHIRPRKEYVVSKQFNEEDMHNSDNLISLCRSCHKSTEGLFRDCNPDEFVERCKEHSDFLGLDC